MDHLPQKGVFMDFDKWNFQKENTLNVITGEKEELFTLRLERDKEWYLRITFDKSGHVRFLNSNGAYISDLGKIFLKAKDIIRRECL